VKITRVESTIVKLPFSQPGPPTGFFGRVFNTQDWAGLARVRQEGGIALAAGENASKPIDFKHMFDAGAITYAQPSVTKVGGVTALREVATLAEAAGVTLVPHSPYFGPGLLATLHSWPRSRASR